MWLYTSGKGWIAVVAALVAAGLALRGLGLSSHAALALVLVAGGLAVIWRRGGSLRPGSAPLSLAGIALVAGGARSCSSPAAARHASRSGRDRRRAAARHRPVALAARGRARPSGSAVEERAEMAARVHDSVLQTLALVQRHADEPRRVASLARRQERELRGWLYGNGAGERGDTLARRARRRRGRDRGGARRPRRARERRRLPARRRRHAPSCSPRARRCRTRPSSPAPTRSRCTPRPTTTTVSVFVRDRGAGFDRAAVPADRRGLAESIEARMARAGGAASIVSSPGDRAPRSS